MTSNRTHVMQERLTFQIIRDFGELGESGLEGLDNFGGDDVGIGIFERLRSRMKCQNIDATLFQVGSSDQFQWSVSRQRVRHGWSGSTCSCISSRRGLSFRGSDGEGGDGGGGGGWGAERGAQA